MIDDFRDYSPQRFEADTEQLRHAENGPINELNGVLEANTVAGKGKNPRFFDLGPACEERDQRVKAAVRSCVLQLCELRYRAYEKKLGWAEVAHSAFRERIGYEAKKRLDYDLLNNSKGEPLYASAASYDLFIEIDDAVREFTTSQPPHPSPPVNQTNPDWSDRRAVVAAFLLKCKQETSLKATRKQIWKSAGHTSARQFQFWQASHPKATAQDDLNFRRILAMNPTAFEALLKNQGII